MTNALKPMTFTMACMAYFGKKPNQSNMEFMAEVKALEPADRAYLTALFPTVGIEITSAVATA
jgi:hypothetical protein